MARRGISSSASRALREEQARSLLTKTDGASTGRRSIEAALWSLRRQRWKRMGRGRRRRELLGASVDADARSPAPLGGAKREVVGWFGVPFSQQRALDQRDLSPS